MAFHIRTLLYRSALIQQRIESEQTQPKPDWLRLMRLKRLRLRLADRLHALALCAAMPLPYGNLSSIH